MPILDAALAFALTMLLMATAVTQIVNLLQRAARTRRTQMQEMLEDYFDRELKPVVDRELRRLSGFVDTKASKALAQAAGELQKTDLFSSEDLEQLENVSTEELLEKLMRSQLGAALLEELGNKAQEVFDEMGKRWEAVGDRFTASFRSSSRWWTTGIAFALALVVNVDSWFIMESYLRDRHLTETVTAQLDRITSDAQSAILAAQDTNATLATDTLAFQTARAQIDRLTQSGIPVGWDYFPYACVDRTDPTAARLANSQCEARQGAGGWVLWVLGVLLTAALAGLGAPFWYDVVSGVARVARAGRAPVQPATK